jgi:hypothetical protein
MARIIELIYTTTLDGDGSESNPYRRTTQLWTKAGVLVAERDPFAHKDKDGEPVAQSWIGPEIDEFATDDKWE